MVQAPNCVPKVEPPRNLISSAAVDPDAPHTICTQNSDGKPAVFAALSGTFDLTNDEFNERFLPWVQLAFALLQRDFVGVEELVGDMVRQGGEGRLDEAERAWSDCAEAFSTISEVVEAAQVRLATVRTQIST